VLVSGDSGTAGAVASGALAETGVTGIGLLWPLTGLLLGLALYLAAARRRTDVA
jgi:hypothetical protein